MKKIALSYIILLSLGSNSFAFAQNEKVQNNNVNTTQITILEKGVKRRITIPNSDTSKNKANSNNKEQQSTKEGIIVKFENPSEVSISNFEEKYSLKLKEKLVIGYYIFQNVSENSDIQIIETIIENEKNIKTVKPNWKMKNTPM